MLMKKVAVVAALLLFLPFVVNAKDGNVAGWKPNKTPETPESDLTAPPLVFNVTEAKEEWLELNVAASAKGYTAFMNELHQRLVDTRGNKWTIRWTPVLGVQKINWEPDTWIHVVLKGGQGETSTLAIRADNLYLVGFRTNEGSWYVFKNRNLYRRNISLNFNDDYKSLTGGRGHRHLDRVDVRRHSALKATSILARYKPDGSTSDADLQTALATFILMICEAQRFTTISDFVSKAWDTKLETHVPTRELELVVKWKVISCALLSWDQRWDGTRNWKDIPLAKEIAKYGNPRMTSPWAAAKNLNFILQVTWYNCEAIKK
ncbi:protein synthesis inhibitor II-like [Triticum aestivum]|uniref:protein synthesis inhibitor II-like n=1 Tax=Triticum aestivum TaxID=4565 RepID=UPI001D033ED6|nr:protein synthesis inhibitor II-like [Triticum aestivum]